MPRINVKKCSGIFVRIASAAVVSGYVGTVLYPNITGWVHVGVNSNSGENWTSDGGLFYNSGIGTGGQAPITGRDGRQIWFSPNRVCSLYGKSSTIQTKSFYALIIIKI